MELTVLNLAVYVLIPILTAVLGGWVGAYFGNKYRENKETYERERVRGVAIKALNILKSYSMMSFRKAEGEFNKTMSIAEKRAIIVALHKLGIPFGVPSNETFNIREVHFIDTAIIEDDIDDIILQITKGYCDNLFYIDPDTYFASNFTLFAMRNAGKKYVTEILARSKVNPETKILTEPVDLGSVFTLGEYKAIQVLREQVRDQMYFDENGEPIKEKIDTLMKDIDLGLWDSYLLWNFENYQSVKAQVQVGQMICNPQPLINPAPIFQPDKRKGKEDRVSLTDSRKRW